MLLRKQDLFRFLLLFLLLFLVYLLLAHAASWLKEVLPFVWHASLVVVVCALVSRSFLFGLNHLTLLELFLLEFLGSLVELALIVQLRILHNALDSAGTGDHVDETGHPDIYLVLGLGKQGKHSVDSPEHEQMPPLFGHI